MNKINLFFLSLLFLTILSSCRNIKDLTYLQEVARNEMLSSPQKNIPEYKIRSMDNLYVSIKTLDPEVNQLFSPSGQTGGYMTGTQQMYGDQVSQYINGFQVDSTGYINLPILGKVNLVGLTLENARKKIQNESLEYLQEPVVQLKLLSFRINVSGEVKTPGIYYNYQGSINVLEAISMANGISDDANIKNVLVIRRNGDYSETYKLDLSKKDFFKSEGFYLNPYDMVYVNPGPNKKISLNLQTYQLLITTISTLAGLTFLYQPFQGITN